MCSEFDLPWFDLDVREAKDSVRTTRSRAKAAKPSTAAESSGTYMYYRIPLHVVREGRGRGKERGRQSSHTEYIPINAHHHYHFLMHTFPQLRNPDSEWMQ
jgi:hypothetical protein